jgi:hypothetical protein
VYVLLGIIWGIELNDPVYFRDVQTSSGDISTQQDARFGGNKLEEGSGPFGLLLLSMDTHDREVNVIEELVMKFD